MTQRSPPHASSSSSNIKSNNNDVPWGLTRSGILPEVTYQPPGCLTTTPFNTTTPLHSMESPPHHLLPSSPPNINNNNNVHPDLTRSGILPTMTFQPPRCLIPSTKKSHAHKKPPGYIPRPRNAFMLFRSDFVREKKVPETVEKQHRNISKIAGIIWGNMSNAEKEPWREMAEKEKEMHFFLYPGYKYPSNKKRIIERRRKSKVARVSAEEDRFITNTEPPENACARRKSRKIIKRRTISKVSVSSSKSPH